MRATFALAGLLGFGFRRRLAAQPWAEMKIVNPVGARPDNDVALTATKSAVSFVHDFDPRADTLTIAEPAYGELDFGPQFVQHLGGIKFVCLDPQPDAGR